MANEIILNNYSDDSQIKRYISEVLMPRVFHDIPLNILNTGFYSIINEYMSQALEQQSFTSSFYFNESFITKAVLPDSIYAEAAIFNIGYDYAIPSSCNFLLELKISDIFNNAVYNPDTRLYEFILDKNTQFNLSNGNVYSLDYDILIQYQKIETAMTDSAVQAWNVQYTNLSDQNSIAKNKNVYITYRVTDTWLCLFLQASEYVRETYTVVNNMTNGIPNEDYIIKCNNHIAGFDIKYVDGDGNETYLSTDHILPIHANVTDSAPYIHYIMDNPQTIRFMFQLNGNRYFVPSLNSHYEITVYTCHGEAANFSAFKNDEQPSLITASNKYTNNANVMKAVFVISGSMGGTNIGTSETVRRRTIEAYNTVNVLSTDHDLDEWFKTFYFKNVLYPYFFKRRDDPWGRIWSGFLALKDDDDYIFRTNTLHAEIPYQVLYNNNDNTLSNNEIIIPPGWIWTYVSGEKARYAVTPYTNGNGVTVETANTLKSLTDKFVFSNPFGIRIQKNPFAIGYFNPWVNAYITTTNLNYTQIDRSDDISRIYHATPLFVNIKRTYAENYYKISTFISPTISALWDESPLVSYLRKNISPPIFTEDFWNYFKEPMDLYNSDIPILPLTENTGYVPFNPSKTYFCVRNRLQIDDDKWALSDIWIEDETDEDDIKTVPISITGPVDMLYGKDSLWGLNGIWKETYVTGDTAIKLSGYTDNDMISFEQITGRDFYEMRLVEQPTIETGSGTRDIIISSIELTTSKAVKTQRTKYGEANLYKLGYSYNDVTINVTYNYYYANDISSSGSVTKQYTIRNAKEVLLPYSDEVTPIIDEYGLYHFMIPASADETETGYLDHTTVLLYADMKPSADSGTVDYYKIAFSDIPLGDTLFYIKTSVLPLYKNNMRVILHALMNGSEVGRVEMQPVRKDEDGTYLYEADAYPLNQLVDVDNRIQIASTEYGGGNWTPSNPGASISIDATQPEFKISILFKSELEMRDSDIVIGDSYTGFRIVDQYKIDDFSLVQELKEMRSVVNFGDSSVPTTEQLDLYHDLIGMHKYDSTSDGNLYTIQVYAEHRMHGEVIDTDVMSFDVIQTIAVTMMEQWLSDIEVYQSIVDESKTAYMLEFELMMNLIINTTDPYGDNLDWELFWDILNSYDTEIESAFSSVNIDGGMEVQLVPFVEYSLMNSDRFSSFISAFTQVHEAIEPVIFERLDGNHYLDCKLLATYGLPHSYSSDLDYDRENAYWPDLNVRITFDIKLYNQALATNTTNELRTIIKTYFNRLTSIHTAKDAISMDNNIYISQLIQQIEAHSNVAYLKFKGWYTDEKNDRDGRYMDANTQAIVQKWKRIDDFPKEELERFVPEMFVMEDSDIVLNIIDKV